MLQKFTSGWPLLAHGRLHSRGRALAVYVEVDVVVDIKAEH